MRRGQRASHRTSANCRRFWCPTFGLIEERPVHQKQPQSSRMANRSPAEPEPGRKGFKTQNNPAMFPLIMPLQAAFFPGPPGVRALYTPLTPCMSGKQWGQVGELVSLHFCLWMGIDESEGSRGCRAYIVLLQFSGNYLKSDSSPWDRFWSEALVLSDLSPLFVISKQTRQDWRGTHAMNKVNIVQYFFFLLHWHARLSHFNSDRQRKLSDVFVESVFKRCSKNKKLCLNVVWLFWLIHNTWVAQPE